MPSSMVCSLLEEFLTTEDPERHRGERFTCLLKLPQSLT
jgi:hypothetical protein